MILTKKIFLPFLSLYMMLESCQPASNHEEVTSASLSPGCYVFTQNNSKITMHVDEAGEKVQGDLTYDIFEKDKNTGIIEGTLSGDTLFALYTFFSEGVESKREVAYLVKGDSLIEGYGNAVEAEGILRFENRRSIDFSQGTLLVKTTCNTDS